ncbi:MAG: hypothetical protein JJU45_16430 [Acidimicrobiia bacterium]|nr:hypothetical protein [Acidimicrobiia bacterium]
MAGIYIERDGELANLQLAKFEAEEDFQQLLEDHAVLLAGDQINRDSPRRFVLVCREARIPSEAGGSDRWSADHLFIDQDAVPTIVEVKPKEDTRLRREVVGQMLDYASNASVYWEQGHLRALFDRTWEAKGSSPLAALAALYEHGTPSEAVADQFWDQADANLEAGRLRMLFVADEIPLELQRIIEFLNEHMSPAEVLGIEIRQYVGGGMRAMVPSVIGQTAAARTTKRRASDGREFGELAAEMGATFHAAQAKLDEWAEREGLVVAEQGKSRRYLLGDRPIVYLFPGSDAIELLTQPLEPDTTWLREALSEVSVAPDLAKPKVATRYLAERWDDLERTVLAPYLAAFRSIEEAASGS